jgi:hypothetical protein
MENQYTDYYLKADTTEILISSLIDAGIYLEGTTTISDPIMYSLYVIGEMIRGTGQFEDYFNGVVTRQREIVELVPGVHANLRVLGTLTAEQIQKLPLVDAPATPKYIWA